MPTPSTTTPTSLWTALARLLGGTDRTHDDTQATDDNDPPTDESTPQADELADPGPDSNGLVSDANARTEQDHVLDHMTAPAPAANRGDRWNNHDWDDAANPASDWADVPTDDVYDTPIPYAAPAWLEESRAAEYDDYDAAIPFRVVDDYTRHMSDDSADSADTGDGDDL